MRIEVSVSVTLEADSEDEAENQVKEALSAFIITSCDADEVEDDQDPPVEEDEE